MESPPTSEGLPPPSIDTEAALNDLTQEDVAEIPAARMSSRRNSSSLDDSLDPAQPRNGVNFSVPEIEDHQFNPQLPVTGRIDRDIVPTVELASGEALLGVRPATNEVVAIPAAYAVGRDVVPAVNDNEVAMTPSAYRIDADYVGAHNFSPQIAPLSRLVVNGLTAIDSSHRFGRDIVPAFEPGSGEDPWCARLVLEDAATIADDATDDVDIKISSIVAGQTGHGTVSVPFGRSSPTVVHAWIDFNRDDVFSASEQVVRDLLVGSSNASFSFSVPADAQPGTTWARFCYEGEYEIRYADSVLESDAGIIDYPVTILPGGGDGGQNSRWPG